MSKWLFFKGTKKIHSVKYKTDMYFIKPVGISYIMESMGPIGVIKTDYVTVSVVIRILLFHNRPAVSLYVAPISLYMGVCRGRMSRQI